MAGKGDRARHTVNDTWRENYERAFAKKPHLLCAKCSVDVAQVPSAATARTEDTVDTTQSKQNNHMANNYTQSSSILEIPNDKLAQAVLIVERFKDELENSEEGYVGFEASFECASLWIRDGGENFAADHVMLLVQSLLDDLQIDAPFVFSWANTCSKPRVDEFNGGACLVRRGKDPIWCDPINEVCRQDALREVKQSELL
jgi:hypothetical protein